MESSVTIDYFGRALTISTGGVAKQADGSVLVRYGDTVVLVTAVVNKEREEDDFLPLTVNYQEMQYAAGKFPGGFFKREGRPSQSEILVARLIDRPLRPSFPKGFRKEVQVVATVVAIDMHKHKATLEFPDGSRKTVAVRPDVDLTQRKVGEKVVIRKTEAMAISVDKP